MLAALDELRTEVADGSFRPRVEDEDVHTALERGLLEKLGGLGGKLRAGRPATTRSPPTCGCTCATTPGSSSTGCRPRAGAGRPGGAAPGHPRARHDAPAARAAGAVRPPAARARAGVRARVARLCDWDLRASVSPLGSGALAGSSLPVDPISTAEELGFGSAAPNSMDAVSDRDFVAEFLFVAALLGVHLSRLGEEVVLWNSTEFGWVTLDDAFSTGSSIMPQKKNPDIAELARGKAGRLIGHVTGSLAMLKGLPLTYDRDMQEAQEPCFDAVETLLLVLPAMAGMIATMTVHADVLEASAPTGFALATDVAELLVKNGVAFRDAHEAVGHLVVWCTVNGKELHEVSDEQLAHVSPHLTPDVRGVLDVRGALAARQAHGGTAPERVREQLEALQREVAAHRSWAASRG
jgi:argininosuccinate lyase